MGTQVPFISHKNLLPGEYFLLMSLLKPAGAKRRRRRRAGGGRTIVLLVALLVLLIAAANYILAGDRGGKETALPGGEKVAWVAFNIPDKKFYGQNEDAVLKIASLAKLPVALVVARMAAGGEIEYDDRVEYIEEKDYVEGTGSLQKTVWPGDSLTVRRLCQLMLEESDNIAYRMLVRQIGADRIRRELEMLNISVKFEGGNLASARDIYKVLSEIWLLVPEENSGAREMIGWMLSSAYRDGIPKGVPGAALVANKEGLISNSVVADAGFILTPKPCILVVIVNDLEDQESYRIIRDVSARLYRKVAR